MSNGSRALSSFDSKTFVLKNFSRRARVRMLFGTRTFCLALSFLSNPKKTEQIVELSNRALSVRRSALDEFRKHHLKKFSLFPVRSVCVRADMVLARHFA